MPASRLGLTSSKSEVLTLTRMVRPAYTLLLVAATSTLLAAESLRSTLLFSSPSISKPDELGEQRHMVAAFMPEELPFAQMSIDPILVEKALPVVNKAITHVMHLYIHL